MNYPKCLACTHLDYIFVFGSNLKGRHGKGAALHALEYHGAIYGRATGFQGQSYAIPTKTTPAKSLPLKTIEFYMAEFLKVAADRQDLTFFVTAIGTGLAGFSHQQIAPLFTNAPKNCILPEEWKKYIFTE